MIDHHHKLLPYNAHSEWLVEPFRKADWVDVSKGILKHGLPPAFVAELLGTFPNAGFHKRLVALSVERLRTHPFSPLPMMKL